MKYEKEIIDNILLLKLSGDLIGENNGPGLVEVLNEHINKGVYKCIIDMSEVRYMNSSGIGVLITILTKLRNKNGEVVLLQPSDQVKKLLIITKLNNIFSFFESKEEAVQNLK
ncbi:STAS domain-containing protein [Marivirga sp. S37H4]|uniref:Anti-sigma factor antagonist n=1 Tax=Marivirga aurantiaca TaxID=2802615 RepID=A0A934WZ06_9BACT|nr:STAS domain-containing protein [Marivirga aurantiaca]MBK6265425.1 STAS domain-containing protein [Marivirga aurantiaca]